MERSFAETLNLQASAVAAGDVVLPQATAIPTKPINSLADECLPPMGRYSALHRSDPQLPQGVVHGAAARAGRSHHTVVLRFDQVGWPR